MPAVETTGVSVGVVVVGVVVLGSTLHLLLGFLHNHASHNGRVHAEVAARLANHQEGRVGGATDTKCPWSKNQEIDQMWCQTPTNLAATWTPAWSVRPYPSLRFGCFLWRKLPVLIWHGAEDRVLPKSAPLGNVPSSPVSGRQGHPDRPLPKLLKKQTSARTFQGPAVPAVPTRE